MIFVLAVGLAAGAMRLVPPSLDRLAVELKQQCAEARKTACCQRRNVAIAYDPETHRIFTEETELQLPEALKILAGPHEIQEKRDLFVFTPNGAGEAAKYRFELGKERLTLSISPLTGRLLIHDL